VHGESAPIFVGQLHASPPQLVAKHTILFEQIPKDIPLLAVQPAGQKCEQQLERGGVEHGGSLYHGPQIVRPSPSIQSWDTTRRGGHAAGLNPRSRSEVERRVRRRFRDAGIRVVLTPARAPNANAYAERFVRPIKEERLDRLIPIGERHFRRAVAEFIEHYHGERNHQGLGDGLISGLPVIKMTSRRPTPSAARRVAQFL
jgi:hypothetical protein